MKRAIFGISMMLLTGTLLGCATSKDLARVEEQEKLIGAKADQALQEARAAKVTADSAKQQADLAAVRAENAVKAAEARENAAAERQASQSKGAVADENEQRAAAVFRNSMMK